MRCDIHILGLGVAEKTMLSESAQLALKNSDWLIGSRRQIKAVDQYSFSNNKNTQILTLPPLKELLSWIQNLEADNTQSIVILASGDPLFYGIGGWLSRHFEQSCLHFYPQVSSIQVACHSLGLSLQDINVLSLHGRPLEKIHSQLKQNTTLVILTDKYSYPQALAKECIKAGFEDSTIHVCEALGYEHEKISLFTVKDLANIDMSFDPLHVSIIQTKGCSHYLPEFPGINDKHFITDGEAGKGMITKCEVRLNILSLMQSANGDVIWDIGAGCGSVAVELAFWNSSSKVYAIEHHGQRLECLQQNRKKFGVINSLNIIAGRAPQVLDELPKPNKVFIGGSDGVLAQLLELVWNKLPLGGVLVASSVMENSKQSLIEFMNFREAEKDSDIETLVVAVSRGSTLAGQLLYRPSLPVTLFKWLKKEQTL